MLATLLGSLGLATTLGGASGLLGFIVSLIFGARLRFALMGGIFGGIFIAVIYGAGYVKGKAQCENAVELASAQARIKAQQHEIDALNATTKIQNQLDERNIKEMAEDDNRIAELERLLGARVPKMVCPKAATKEMMRQIERIK